MLRVKIKVIGAKKITKRIENFKKRLEFPRPAFENVQNYMLRQIPKQFETHGSLFGTPWEPLSESTLHYKAHLVSEGRISPEVVSQPLVRTGLMKRSFRGRIMGRNILVIENPIKYFRLHQLGAMIHPFGMGKKLVRLPQRIMMKFDKQRREVIGHIFLKWIIQTLKHAFTR